VDLHKYFKLSLASLTNDVQATLSEIGKAAQTFNKVSEDMVVESDVQLMIQRNKSKQPVITAVKFE